MIKRSNKQQFSLGLLLCLCNYPRAGKPAGIAVKQKGNKMIGGVVANYLRGKGYAEKLVCTYPDFSSFEIQQILIDGYTLRESGKNYAHTELYKWETAEKSGWKTKRVFVLNKCTEHYTYNFVTNEKRVKAVFDQMVQDYQSKRDEAQLTNIKKSFVSLCKYIWDNTAFSSHPTAAYCWWKLCGCLDKTALAFQLIAANEELIMDTKIGEEDTETSKNARFWCQTLNQSSTTAKVLEYYKKYQEY